MISCCSGCHLPSDWVPPVVGGGCRHDVHHVSTTKKFANTFKGPVSRQARARSPHALSRPPHEPTSREPTHRRGTTVTSAAASPSAFSSRSSSVAAASASANSPRERLCLADRVLAARTRSLSRHANLPPANLPVATAQLSPAPPPHPRPSRPAPRRSPRRPPAQTRLMNAFARPIARS